MGASTYSSRNTLRLSFDLIRSRNTQSRARGGRKVERGGGEGGGDSTRDGGGRKTVVISRSVRAPRELASPRKRRHALSGTD